VDTTASPHMATIAQLSAIRSGSPRACGQGPQHTLRLRRCHALPSLASHRVQTGGAGLIGVTRRGEGARSGCSPEVSPSACSDEATTTSTTARSSRRGVALSLGLSLFGTATFVTSAAWAATMPDSEPTVGRPGGRTKLYLPFCRTSEGRPGDGYRLPSTETKTC